MALAHCLRPVSLSLLPLTLFSLAVLGTTGCSLNQASSSSSTPSSTAQNLQGHVHGGQQPVVGATIQLYAAGTTGYGQGAASLGTATTDSSGSFSLTYTPPSTPSYFYIVSTGGSPGNVDSAYPNTNIVLMAAISGCTATTTLSSSFINIDEVTTAAAVLEFAAGVQSYPFMASPTGIAGAPVQIGAPSGNVNDLRTAFESASNLVDISSGTVVNPTGSKGQLINTLADILASCVNSDPHNYPENCSNLSINATPSGDTTAAADTAQAAWYIAQNPANNVSVLTGLASPSSPFQPYNHVPASFAVTAPTDLVACFAVLGSSTVTNTGATVVSGGDLGLYSGTSVTGFTFSAAPGPGTVTAPATNHITDSVAENAQSDLTLAYDYVAGLSATPGSLPADMGGSTFLPGVYKNSAAVGLSSNMTLNANGDPDAVFVFQIGAALTTTAGVITLENGAQPGNVFWQVGTSATIGTPFVGTIMALDSITLSTGVPLEGRALASTAAVSLADNAVTAP